MPKRSGAMRAFEEGSAQSQLGKGADTYQKNEKYGMSDREKSLKG
jgi:hypothetical protein